MGEGESLAGSSRPQEGSRFLDTQNSHTPRARAQDMLQELTYLKTIQPKAPPCLKLYYCGTLWESPGPPQTRCSNWLIFLGRVKLSRQSLYRASKGHAVARNRGQRSHTIKWPSWGLSAPSPTLIPHPHQSLTQKGSGRSPSALQGPGRPLSPQHQPPRGQGRWKSQILVERAMTALCGVCGYQGWSQRHFLGG